MKLLGIYKLKDKQIEVISSFSYKRIVLLFPCQLIMASKLFMQFYYMYLKLVVGVK